MKELTDKFVYGFLAIITLVTVLNIMNSISMSVSARIKQYGAMRAVYMDEHQLTKMIAAVHAPAKRIRNISVTETIN